jgi:DNA-binding FrmR family transcriptional regulator
VKTTEQLINNLVGQLKAINRMILAEEDCFEVLTQLKAVRSGVANVMEKFMGEEMKACLKKGGRETEKMGRLIDEFTKN